MSKIDKAIRVTLSVIIWGIVMLGLTTALVLAYRALVWAIGSLL